MKKFERKINFVDSSVQGALVKRIMIHWLSFFAVTALSFVMLQSLLGNPDVPLTQRISQKVAEFSLLGILMLAILPAFCLDTIRFSNRFVGPILRLRRALNEVNQTGDCDPIKFRDDDFWKEMAHEFNGVVDQLRSAKAQAQPLADATLDR